MAFEEFKERQAQVWGAGEFELMAATLTPVYDDLVGRLGVNPGEEWLDVACGTGGVAMTAARRGARVTGHDLAPGLIETAARLTAEACLSIDYEIADVEDIPAAEGSYDVISSAQGAIFGPDHAAVARELARVCRPGGRIGLTAWRPGSSVEKSIAVMSRFGPPPPEGAGNPIDWGRPEYATEMLGEAFELEFHEGDSPHTEASVDALWELFSAAMGPMQMLLRSGDDTRVREVHDAFVEFYGQYTKPDGTVSQPREYLVIVGHRR